jgi:uncharacterized protein (TIGR00730 family)
MSKLTAIAVFCGSSPSNDDTIFRAAYGVGKHLATHKLDIVFGGSKLGLMGQVAQGALDACGNVIGVIPEFLRTKEVVHNHLTELIITDSMQERKLKMHELSDGIITLPGGFGTFEELFEMLTWAQLGLHKKPIGILNTNGYYDDLLVMLKTMVNKELLSKENFELLLVDSDLDQLIKKMESFTPLPVPEWMNKDQA